MAKREDGRGTVAGEGGSEVKQPHLPLTKTLVNKLHCSPTAVQCGEGGGRAKEPQETNPPVG